MEQQNMNLPISPFFRKNRKNRKNKNAGISKPAFLLLLGKLKNKGLLTEEDVSEITKLLYT